jgi:hypothetical protein
MKTSDLVGGGVLGDDHGDVGGRRHALGVSLRAGGGEGIADGGGRERGDRSRGKSDSDHDVSERGAAAL